MNSIEQPHTLPPDHLAGWRIGDLADVPTLGRVQVQALRPPGEIVIRTSTGATARVGWRTLQRVRARD